MIFDILNKFYDILAPHERRNAVLLFCLILITGIMEAVGVASIIPFLSVLASPDVIYKNSVLSFFYKALSFSRTENFLIFLGCVVFAIVLIRIFLRALTQYSIIRFSQIRNYTLSTRLLQIYLSRPYSWFLNRHSADLGKTVLSEVQQLIQQALIPTAQLIASIVISICLVSLMVIVNARVAISAAILLGGAYGLIYFFLRGYINEIGSDRLRANRERFQIAQEALGGIKEVKAAGLESGYITSYRCPALAFARSQSANEVAGQLPNYMMQAITFGGIIVITLFLLKEHNGDLGGILPVLGVFAFAGQRLMPALNQIYANATNMRYGKPTLDAFYEDFMEKHANSKSLEDMNKACEIPPIGLKHGLELKNVAFRYPGADNSIFKNLNLNIKANTTIGLVGSTGAGKTTLVDVILGLLFPQQGSLEVDGVTITDKNIASWQRTLGYVPQQIFLADDTVTANIAFGIPANEVDMHAVERAARIAELHNFVIQELNKGYDTFVGERGVRLSGGQRQRIGIARALYNDPDVLILDEATSSLDNITERAVMEAVNNLSKKKTIVMVAHRLSTVRNCDEILMLERGALTARGTYSYLFETSREFKQMAVASA